ncbi:glycosyltransferase family 4 protein [Rhizobium sp. SSA_523]|uniref:glycosyltransferase family 4 protein n=1 Tax=Rhizobium sp. SSA_523 TaxID=2952477 RepID=UPI002091976F|nr:glycosyltransferase family 4 protein [Rhizobium sp. SSA_523]MCO5732484.1 glycosyltransferase family 4 protein [Rhizobium sp. SSA_523]WKC22375.1 glycosyltransferase family 4 protein [Rhizobium sp. SSA_523]
MRGELVFAYPGDLDTKTGGYGYDRQLIAELIALGQPVRTIGLGNGFPNPAADVLEHAGSLLSALPDDSLVLIDGLAFGVMGEWAAREAQRLRIVALVHHPLGLESGLSAAAREALLEREAMALAHVRHVIVTSPATARELSSLFSIPAQAITVALPGTAHAARAKPHNAVPHIVSIGSLTTRKGHDVLMRALARLEDLPFTATIIGSPDLDPAVAAALAGLRDELDLGDRLILAGEVLDVADELAKADIFALASRYEGYGMVFAEALAYGLPVIGCAAGAVPDVVPSDAGILVPVDDVEAFAAALRRLLSDTAARQHMAEASYRAGQALPTWQQTGAIVADSLRTVA